MKRVLSCLVLLVSFAALAHSGEAKPNVVIIIADDLTWHDVACFGGPTNAQTPHLDALAAQGMRLTRFYSPAAVCSPTRQALLTGLYPVRSGAYPNHTMVREGTRSLPHHLKDLGYRTGCFGKTHFAPDASYPFDVRTGFAVDAGKQAGKNAGKQKDADKPASGEDANDYGELDVGALGSFFASKDQPFCAYLAPHEPHSPWTLGDRSPYDAAKLTLPPYLIDTPETRAALVAYYAEVTFLDRTIGAVMAALERSGQAGNTLVLFVSEQGSSVPHGKWTLYDPGIHVAAIARWPGHIAAGSTNAALVQYVDVLPTLIAAAGGDPSAIDPGCPDALGRTPIDGRSFLDVLLGKTTTHRDVVFAQHTTNGIIRGSKAYASRAVCDGRWKLIWNLHADEVFHNAISDGGILKSWRAKGEAGDAFAAEQAARYGRRPEWELYDLQADPWELTNVAAKPEHAATITALRAKLDGWMKQQGDLGDQTEREALQHQPKHQRGEP
jgi:N-sulfoglucosamine sulfohydrolase